MAWLGVAVGFGLLAGALGVMAATGQAERHGGLQESGAQQLPIQFGRLSRDQLLAQAPIQAGNRSATGYRKWRLSRGAPCQCGE